MKRLTFLVLCLFLLISGCEKKKEQATPAVEPLSLEAPEAILTTATLLQEPIEAHLFELPVQALPVWRSFRGSKPILVLLSQDPFLQPIPAALEKEAIDLALKGTPEEFAERTSMPGPNPLLLPRMAVDTALRSNLFSEVVWIFPSTVPKDQLDIEQFRQQLLEFGAIDEDEAQTFIPLAGGFAGTVRGLPFRAVPPDALPILERPVVLHIDLGFFQPLYKGEIKTALYPLLYNSLGNLRETAMDTAAVTISFSNMSGTLPLTARFIGPTLAHLVNNPEMLDNKLPLNWQRRANALYLPNFFKIEEARDLFLEMEIDLPVDPSVKYDLYQNSRELKEGDKALDYLKQAVALDPVYALEYLTLASLALERGLPEQAVKMLRLAEQAMPDNPQISLQLAAQLNDLNHSGQTRKILEKLRELPWSTVYYPDMGVHIDAMLAAVKEKQRP